MGFSLRRSAIFAATLGTGVLTAWIIASLDSWGVTDFKNSGAAVPLEDRGGTTSQRREQTLSRTTCGCQYGYGDICQSNRGVG